MSDLSHEHQNYLVLKSDWDEMNALARQYGYTDNEIQELHRAAASMSEALGYKHVNAFGITMRMGQPKITQDFDITQLGRKRTMWDNIRWRLGIWAHRITDRWKWRWYVSRPERIETQFKGMQGQGQDD